MTDDDRTRFMLKYGSEDDIKKAVTNRAAFTQASFLLQAIKHNPAAGPDIYHMAWKHPGLQTKIAKHPKLPDELHHAALYSDNVDVQEMALLNPKTKFHHREERTKNSQFSYIREMAQSLNDDWRRQHKGD